MNGVTNIISPVGRALQQKLSSMNQEQFQQYVMQQMNAGVIRSFPEILALKSQYDALQKGSKQQPAPQGTVADEMAMQMAQPTPQAPMPNAGLAGLPQAQEGYARGGVVAFGAGSAVPPAGPASMTPEEFLKFLEEQRAAEAAARGRPPALPAKPSTLRTPIGELTKGKGSSVMRGANAMLGPAVATGVATGVGEMALRRPGAESLREAGRRMERDKESLSLPIDPSVLYNPLGAAIGLPIKNAIREYGMTNEGLLPDLIVGSDALDRNILSNLTLGRVRSPLSYLEDPAAPAAEKKKEEGLPPPPFGQRLDLSSGMGRINVPAPPSIPAGMGEWNGPKEEAPKGRDKYLEELRLRYQSEGIGAKDAEYQAQLAADRKELEYDKRVAPWLALAQAGFRMAAEGGKSGATFLGSAGAGAEEGLKTYKELKSDIKKTNREQQKAERDFATAKELRTMGMMKDADALQSDAEKRYDTIMLAKAEHTTKILQMKFQQEGLYYGARMNAIIAEYGARSRVDIQERIINGMGQILNNAGSDPQSQAAARKEADAFLNYYTSVLEKIGKSQGAGLAASLKAQGLGSGAGPQPNGVAEVTTP